MDGGGINISTTNGIAAIVFLVGTIGTLLKVIRDLYLSRIADRDAALAKQDERILRLEQDIKDQNNVLKRAADSLDRASDLLDRQTGIAEEIVRKVPAAAAKRRGAE